MDEIEDLELVEIAQKLASEFVDEEIVHHPELISQKNILIDRKTKQFAQQIKNHNDNLYNELTLGSALIKEHFLLLSPNIKDSLLEGLNGVELFKEQEKDKTLQDSLSLPEPIMQEIYKFAIELQEKENDQDAIAVLKFLIILNPLIGDFWSALGVSQSCLGLFQEALKSFQHSIANDPQNPRDYCYAAYTHCLLKDEDSALTQIEEGLKLVNSPLFSEWESTLKEIHSTLIEIKESV